VYLHAKKIRIENKAIGIMARGIHWGLELLRHVALQPLAAKENRVVPNKRIKAPQKSNEMGPDIQQLIVQATNPESTTHFYYFFFGGGMKSIWVSTSEKKIAKRTRGAVNTENKTTKLVRKFTRTSAGTGDR
tara:strand:- start:59 stop:454 length:396 start_codon:yes stop_codon:yes gene_type:complete